MGNSASDIVSRVTGLTNENLSKNQAQDLELLEDPSFVFSPNKLMCRVDLDPYTVPGSDSLRAKEDDVGNQDEESMICSLNNIDRLREKHQDACKALLEDILRKRGDDPNSREMTLRLQGLCRIFEALLRVDERVKRRNEEDKKIEPIKPKALSPIVRTTMKFGLNSLFHVVDVMGKANPQVYKFMISHTSEVLSDIEPLSLKTDDISINSSIEKIVNFFEKVLSGEIKEIADEDRLSSISSLLAIALATGNLSSILTLASQFMKLSRSPNLTLLMKSISPLLKSFNDLINFSEYLAWDAEKCSSNLKLSINKQSLAANQTSNNSCLSQQYFTSGMHYFEVALDNYNDAVYFGVVDSNYTSFNAFYDSNLVSFVYQSTGSILKQSAEVEKFEKSKSGDRIGIFLNMEAKTVTFYKNGVREQKGNYGPVPDKVRIFVSLYGTVGASIVTNPDIPSDVKEEMLKFHKQINPAEPPLIEKLSKEINDGEFLDIMPCEISSFILQKLANLNDPILQLIGNGEKIAIQKQTGIALDIKLGIFDLLDSILLAFIECGRDEERVPAEICHNTIASTVKLMRAHLLASTMFQDVSLPKEKRHQIMEHMTHVLDFFPDTSASEEATKALSSCFSVFYQDSQEKLSYLIDRLVDFKDCKQQSGIFKDLQDKIFLEMAIPIKLYPALDIVDDDSYAKIEKYLLLASEEAARASMAIIDGTESSTGVIKLLETSQLVLFSHAARGNYQGKWQNLIEFYTIKIFTLCDGVIRHIQESRADGNISEKLYSDIQKTILKNLLEGLLYILMLSKLGLNMLSQFLPILQNLIASLSHFYSPPPKLTIGSGIVTERYESPHNYPDNWNVTHLIKIPQVKKYSLIFDAQCKTENGCDYLELWTDESKTNKIARWEGENFPKQPFEVYNPLLFFTFHSDGSVNYWGWKIEVQAEVEASYYEKQWPDTTKEASSILLGLISTKLISGDFELIQEDDEVVKLLSNPLLMYGIKDSCLRIEKQPGPIEESLLILSTTPGVGEKLKRAMLTRSYSEDVSRRVVRTQEVAISLEDYASNYGFWDDVVYSENKFLQEFILGSNLIITAWNEIKKLSGVAGPASNVGGADMDMAERAIFAVYAAFFEISDTIHRLFENPHDIGETIKFIVKQSNLIRGWAQKRKQEIIDQGNPNISYKDICADIVKRCALLLGTEYKMSLNELGINKVMINLLSNVVKVQTNDSNKLKEGSKWKTVQEAVNTASTLKNLLHISSKAHESENEDLKEFLKVSELVNNFLESHCSLDKLIDAIDKRRTRAIARTLGYLCLANLVNYSGKQETYLIRSFGDSLREKGIKKHYWSGLEGVDPTLLLVVQKSFYQIFGLLQKELVKSRTRPWTISSYSHYLCVLEGMSSPLKGVDGHMILELQFASTVDILLSWAKGHLGEEVINRQFQISKCITRFGILEEPNIPEGSAKLLLEKREGGPNLYLVYDRGGENVLPIVDFMYSEILIDDYEDAVGEFFVNGEPRHILIKREVISPNGSYLTELPDLNSPKFSPYDEILESEKLDEKQKREKLREKLSKSSWALFKLLMHSIVGSLVENNESKQILVQDLFIRVLFMELKWDDSLRKPDINPLEIQKLSSGSPWIGQMLVPKSYQKNPMVEWIRRFRLETDHYEEFMLRDIINEFVEKADPAMKGVLCKDDIRFIDESIANTIESFEENKNYKGEFDFFRYLRVLRNLAGDFTFEVQDYIENSLLWKTLPEDYYEASRDYDLSNISRVQNIIMGWIKGNDECASVKLLNLFSQSDIPGIVDKSQLPEDIPNEFKNESGNLDLYVALHAILKNQNQEKFIKYVEELENVFKIYDDLPESCEEILKGKKGQSDYIASLLWTLYSCFGSQCIPKVLAKEEYIEEILKLAFLSGSENIILIGLRILSKIIPTQHSPQTLVKTWERIAKLRIDLDKNPDIISLLFSKLGKTNYWYGQRESQKILRRWGYEAESMLLALMAVERWRILVLDYMASSLQETQNNLKAGIPLELGQVGTLYLLAKSSKKYDSLDSVPLELSYVKLKGSSIARGVIKKIEEQKAHVYSVIEDSQIVESLLNVESIEPHVQESSYKYLTVEDKERLGEYILNFWRTLQSSHQGVIKADPNKIVCLRTLYYKLDAMALVCIIDIYEKKDSRKESEIEDMMSLIIRKSKLAKPISKKSYDSLVDEIARKLRKITAPEEEKQQMSDQEAREIMAKWKEEDQVNAMMIMSLEIPAARIVKCFELGIKDMEGVLSYQEPVKEQKAVSLLYKLCPAVVKTKDIPGTAELYQNNMHQFVIYNPQNSQQRKEMISTVSSSIFHDLESLSGTITILAALEGTPYDGEIYYGLKLGNMEIAVTTAPGFPCLIVNGEMASEVDLSQQLEVKVVAKSTGEVSFSFNADSPPIELTETSVFNGLRVGNYGVFLENGKSASLLSLEIYDGRHDGNFNNKYPKPQLLEGGENYVQIRIKEESSDRLRLKLLGYSDEQVIEALSNSHNLSSAIDYAFDHFDKDTMDSHQSLSMSHHCIIQVKVFDKFADVPKDFSLIPVYENGEVIDYVIPNRKIIAFKKENVSDGNVCNGFSIGENPKNYESIGDLTISTENDRSLPIFVRMGPLAPKESNIKEVAFIKTSSPYSVKVPRGFRLISDKEGKCLNIAPRSEKGHYILVGIKEQHSLLDCFVFPFSVVSSISSNSNFGLVDRFDEEEKAKVKEEEKKLDDLSLMEIFGHLYEAEESRMQQASKQLFLSMLKISADTLVNLSERESIGKIIDFLGDDLDSLSDSFNSLIENPKLVTFKENSIKEAILKLIQCTISTSGGTLKVLEYESNHPYEDNLDIDDIITIPGARMLRIEFDPQCHTESGCDPLRFYENSGRQGELANYSGQGESSWKTLEVNGDTVYTWFHTDGSVHYWGYKFTVTPIGATQSGDEGNVSPDSSLWLIEKIANQANLSRGLEAILSPRFIQVLFLFALSSITQDKKSKSLDILRKIFRGQQHRTLNSILDILLQEASTLYKANLSKKSSNALLQSLILLLAQARNQYKINIDDSWFTDFCELLSDMRGLSEKDDYLDAFLFGIFNKGSSSKIEKYFESSHPYKRVTTKEKIEIPGASLLNIEFAPETKADSRDNAYFSYDEDGMVPVESTMMRSATNIAKWSSDPKGPDISLSNENMTITRTNASNWGNAIWNESYSSNVVKINFSIENSSDSTYLYIGIYKAGENYNLAEAIGTDCSTPVWSWKCSGEYITNSSSIDGRAYKTGDLVSLLIDMNKKELTFLLNEAEVHKFTGIAAEVIPCISFGGSNQIVSIKSVEKISSLSSVLNERKLQANKDAVYLWFPVNNGFLAKPKWEHATENAIKSSDSLTLTSTSDTTGIYYSDISITYGQYYVEAQIKSGGQIGLGIFSSNSKTSRDIEDPKQVCYYSDGRVKNQDTNKTKEFGEGSIIGVYVNMDLSQVQFYLNGEVVFSDSYLQPLSEGESYTFAAILTTSSQSITLSQSPNLPSGLDLMKIDESREAQEWGYKIKVVPEFKGRHPEVINSVLSFMNEESKKEWFEVYKPKYSHLFKCGAVDQLVIYLDEFSQMKGKDILKLTNDDLTPTEAELIYYPELEKLSVDEIRQLYQIILDFNKRIENSLYLFNLHIESYENMNELQRVFMGSRNYIFFILKNTLLKDCLGKTHSDVRTEITVDRPKAMRHRHRKDVDVNGQFSIFGQVYRGLISKGNRDFRNAERVFRVSYRGEAASDAGGPYNEAISNMADELQSSFLKLFVPIPNQINDMGENRDCWIVNPNATQKIDYELYLFLGKMMGAAIRTQNNLNLSLSPLFWKRLLWDPVNIKDLRATDLCTVQILEILRNLEENGMTRENFSEAYDIKFSTKDSGGKDVELCEGGTEIPVTFDNAKEYAQLVEKYRLNENPEAYRMIRKGISAVVPMDILNLFSWKQVQTLICGAPDVDVDLLKGNTDYDGSTENDAHIRYFWEVVREMTPKERSLLIKFIWGRSRLPFGRDWRHLKIANFNPSGPVDKYLPQTHTCFFTIDLPRYTSKEVMRQRLLYSVTHCTAIDLDGTAGTGWEDED